MARLDHRSALDPPNLLVDRWIRWPQAGGGTGSLEEMEQQYLKAKGFDSWSEYFLSVGFDGHFNQQKRQFWAHFALWYADPPSLRFKLVHYFATTRFGVWYIRKYLGMKGRIAA